MKVLRKGKVQGKKTSVSLVEKKTWANNNMKKLSWRLQKNGLAYRLVEEETFRAAFGSAIPKKMDRKSWIRTRPKKRPSVQFPLAKSSGQKNKMLLDEIVAKRSKH
eukprot:EG_transcript_24535